MAISKIRGSRAPLLTLALILGSLGVASQGAAVDCGTKISQNVQSHPRYSGTLPNILSTGGDDSYIYGATTWGFVRASLANPSNPGPLALIQIGLKTVLGGTNGGLIYMDCDCNQGASTFAVAQAADGSSRIVSNWVAPSSGVVPGMVAKTTGSSDPVFGNQINVNPVSSSAGIASVYMPGSGKYFAYFPGSSVQIVDVTNPSGLVNEQAALIPSGTFAWGNLLALTSGKVSVPGQGPKTLLAAFVLSSQKLRVAEVDNSGIPTEKASVAASAPNALAFANVNGKAYIFSADSSLGLNVYEYTGSSLVFKANLPGYFTNVTVKGAPGSPLPAIFVHRNSPTDAVDIYDSRWIDSGSTPVRAFSLPHRNSPPPTGRGDAIEAVVTTNGNQIVAHVYRLATTTNPQANPEHLLVTDNIDISCIAADPTSLPVANANFVNLTAAAQSRVGTNYYGDQVQLTDASTTGSAMLSAAWDINTSGVSPASFVRDPAVGTGLSITGYFPCDPSSQATPGNFVTGANCAASLGLGPNAPTQTFRFGEKSTNPNGESVDPFFSAPIQFVMPQIAIAGFDGTTLRVLTGGVANASGTQGNTSSFNWVFRTSSNGILGSPTGSQPIVPAGAAFFDLRVTWPGGYQQTLSNKAIVQTDLVPSFTTSPNPAVKGGSIRVTNTMQKAPSTQVTSVDLSIVSGNCGGTPAFQSNAFPTSFYQNVPTPFDVPAPATEGAYCMTLRYNYDPLSPKSQSVSNPLTVVVPSVAVVANISGPSTGTVGSPLTFTANATGGTGVFTYAWDCNYNSFTGGNFQTGTATKSCTYNRNGSQTPAVKVTDSAVPPHAAIAFANVNITGGTTPPPSTVQASVAGPTTGSAGTALTYTANATGGTQPYTYAWACDYSVLAGSSQFTAGTQTKACTFANNGVHAVAVRVTDSASNGAIGSISTNIAGPSLPSAVFSVTGGTLSGTTITVGAGQPVTFLASEANATSYGWTFGDTTGGTGRTITKTYAVKGTYQGQLIVTGNGNQTNGTGIASFTVQVVTPAPSGAFTVSGANPNAAGTVFTATAGEEITMTASEPNAITWGWDFGDSTSGSARSVKKTYSQLGTYTVKLFVTGNERDTTGLVISTFTVNVVSCVTSGTTLCLNNNRFRASVAWAVPDQGKSGAGTAVALTGDTGYYWFFSPTNIELVLKVVDGRTFNGNFWVFYGALSNVEYTITIKDMTTGAVKTYHNPSGTTASLADVDAFPAPATPASKTAQATSAITVVCTPSTVAIGQQVSCQASPAGTYSWNWGEDFPPRYTAGPNPSTHSWGHAGSLRVSASPNGGATAGSTTVVVTAGSGGVVAAIAGPSTGTSGTALAFTGSATGGTGPYSFAWNCEYDSATPTFTAGVADNPCTYTAVGSRVVALRVTDSATPTPATAVATKTVTIEAPAGPGLPSAAFTLDGATLNSATGKYETEIGRTVTFTATEQHAASWGWVFGDGTIGGGTQPEARIVTHAYAAGGTYAGQLLVQGDGTNTVNLNIGSIPISVLPCAADAQTLCLNNGRFKVRVDWRSDSGSGAAAAVPVTADTGEFWFLSANNIELLIKVVDGSAFNGHFWVFYGALSNFEYTITVTDTTTGAVKTYFNPLGTTASLADIDAF